MINNEDPKDHNAQILAELRAELRAALAEEFAAFDRALQAIEAKWKAARARLLQDQLTGSDTARPRYMM